MRVARAFLLAAAVPFAAGAQAVDNQDWTLACDNTRACRAAGYSVEGSALPVSVLVSRASGAGSPAYVELQLGTLGGPRPASVTLQVAGKPAGAVRLDRDNHAVLPAVPALALVKAVAAGNDIAFVAGASTWRVSAAGAADVLARMDEVQGRSGRLSALVSKGGGSDADVASPMAVPRLDATRVPPATQPGDDALAVRVLASIQSRADCSLLDDGAAQSRARLWHLDANKLLVTQACAASEDADGFWIANLRPPYDARPLTTTGTFDGISTITSRAVTGSRGDCGHVESWTWNGFRFEATYAAGGGLCRGVKAGGAWTLPTLVTDVIPGR